MRKQLRESVLRFQDNNLLLRFPQLLPQVQIALLGFSKQEYNLSLRKQLREAEEKIVVLEGQHREQHDDLQSWIDKLKQCRTEKLDLEQKLELNLTSKIRIKYVVFLICFLLVSC